MDFCFCNNLFVFFWINFSFLIGLLMFVFGYGSLWLKSCISSSVESLMVFWLVEGVLSLLMIFLVLMICIFWLLLV